MKLILQKYLQLNFVNIVYYMSYIIVCVVMVIVLKLDITVHRKKIASDFLHTKTLIIILFMVQSLLLFLTVVSLFVCLF